MPQALALRGLFVTGTDTGVGKSVLAAALAAAIASAGEIVRPYKPVLTGLDEPPDQWPRDHELLAAAAGTEAEQVAPLRFGPAVSPHLAAQLAQAPISLQELVAYARNLAAPPEEREPGATPPILLVEGVGGLLVPLAEGCSVRDLAVALGLPLIVAARPGLGTINHTLLTLEAARAAGLSVAAVVMTPWPADPGTMLRSNRETVEQLGAVSVHVLGPTAPDPRALAEAARDLPWRRWLDG